MGVWGAKSIALSAVLSVAVFTWNAAEAASVRNPKYQGQISAGQTGTAPRAAGISGRASARRDVAVASRNTRSRGARRVAVAAGGISCVPYARQVTGMQISGNGGAWWHNAAGTYGRGQRPEPGAILAFRASGGMSRGHVAVVSRVHGPRHVEIDHANWGGPGIRRGTVMRNVDVIDVSDRNDWSQVRVQVGWQPGTYGRAYPTYGFIYNRPDREVMTAYRDGTTPRAGSADVRLEEVADAGASHAPPRTRTARRR
jgi:hypothetical protein